MLNKNYKKLNPEEKEIAITRLSEYAHVSKEIIHKVLLEMNPVLDIIDGKAAFYKNTLLRLYKKIKNHTK
ncbi:hypothetical protein GCM10007384_05620 [Aquimarina muelleri]|uniref:Uncharacterized protein n=1 Tax=Aquimarina muelleri TaxID=279356 RepID=A0A918JSB8_9FLAO|nr:hypothetical protein GCM10007384_05620 [Aquimarina muelleri]